MRRFGVSRVLLAVLFGASTLAGVLGVTGHLGPQPAASPNHPFLSEGGGPGWPPPPN
jgi:hypothetical protein